MYVMFTDVILPEVMDIVKEKGKAKYKERSVTAVFTYVVAVLTRQLLDTSRGRLKHMNLGRLTQCGAVKINKDIN